MAGARRSSISVTYVKACCVAVLPKVAQLFFLYPGSRDDAFSDMRRTCFITVFNLQFGGAVASG